MTSDAGRATSGIDVSAILAGLCAPAPHVAPKYFYDRLGSILFEAITALPEYYLTRTELGLLAEHANDIAARTGQGITLIDLGAGNCSKAARLFPALRPLQYVAVDISADFVAAALADLARSFPGIEMTAVGGDFAGGISLPAKVRMERRWFFYPGSSIGNLTPEEARALLAMIRAQCPPEGGLLIGVDLRKDESVLNAAYDDALGVTAAFNLNILNHLNVLIGSDFSVRDWRHRARYEPRLSRVDMHLEARRAVQVRWPGGGRSFTAGETIHTESSYKYSREDFAELLVAAGFSSVECWTDGGQWFAFYCAMA